MLYTVLLNFQINSRLPWKVKKNESQIWKWQDLSIKLTITLKQLSTAFHYLGLNVQYDIPGKHTTTALRVQKQQIYTGVNIQG